MEWNIYELKNFDNHYNHRDFHRLYEKYKKELFCRSCKSNNVSVDLIKHINSNHSEYHFYCNKCDFEENIILNIPSCINLSNINNCCCDHYHQPKQKIIRTIRTKYPETFLYLQNDNLSNHVLSGDNLMTIRSNFNGHIKF